MTGAARKGPDGFVFVTRKFPPSIGGMEQLAAAIWRSVRRVSPTGVLIANRRRNRDLVWWVPVALVRLFTVLAAARMRGRRPVVLAGDALTWALIEPVVRLFGAPGATIVHGLDLSYGRSLYRATVRPALRRAPQVISNSRATADQAAALGVAPERLTVLRLGVPVPAPRDRTQARAALLELTGTDPNAFLVVTVGRLVRRKGVRWFVEEVMPHLDSQVHYLIAGDGPESAAIADVAAAVGPSVTGRLHLLGRVSDDTLEDLLAGADLFVQPNIRVDGDMEGFGLVVVEAAVRATPVLAAAIEGIADAVVDGETGLLLPSGDAGAWRRAVTERFTDRPGTAALGAAFAARAKELYGEDRMGEDLAQLLGLR